MIKRQHLKYPLLSVFVFMCFILVFHLIIIIMQPLSNLIGYDWSDTNQNVKANDSDGDGFINCPSYYLIKKVRNAKMIFSISYSWVIISFIFAVYLFVILLFALGSFVTKSEAIDMNRDYRSRVKNARVGALPDLYDEFFSYKITCTLYIAFSVSLIGQIVHMGSLASMLITYQNCESTTDGPLLGLIILSAFVIIFLLMGWIAIVILLYRHRQFLDDNKEDHEATPIIFNQQDFNRNMNPPSPFEADESIIVKTNKQRKNYPNRYRQQEVLSSGLEDDSPQTDQRLQRIQYYQSSKQEQPKKLMRSETSEKSQSVPKKNSHNSKKPSHQKQDSKREEPVVQPKKDETVQYELSQKYSDLKSGSANSNLISEKKSDNKLTNKQLANKVQQQEQVVSRPIGLEWFGSRKKIPDNTENSRRPVPKILNWQNDADREQKISHIDIFSQLQQNKQKQRIRKEQNILPSRRKNNNSGTQKMDYTEYVRRRK